MVTIGVVLYTLFTYTLLVCLSVVYAIPVLIFLCIPARYRYDSKLAYWMFHSFYVLVQKCSLLPITYNGLENLSGEPVIFAANHQSSLDIPLLGALARGVSHVWLARQDILQRYWFLRMIISRAAVMVDVSTPRRGMLSLLKIMSLVYNKHRHIMIFPEGGRFTSGGVHDFYGGFVILVKKLQRPVVPVYIHGVNKVYPPDSWWARREPVTVTVGKPMHMHDGEDDVAFKNRVHQWFLDQVR